MLPMFWFVAVAGGLVGFSLGALVGAVADAWQWRQWLRRRNAWLDELRRDLDGDRNVRREVPRC